MFIFFTVLLVAISLSMDTFSLSLSYGMFNLNKNIIFKTSIIVGISHFIMPIIGLIFGNFLRHFIFIKEELILGIILLIISIELIISLLNKEEIKPLKNNLDIIMFGFAVSIDSLTTGIALSAFKLQPIIIVIIFFIVSTIFTYLGLVLGSKLHNLIGNKTTVIGIIFLILLSIKYIIKGVK